MARHDAPGLPSAAYWSSMRPRYFDDAAASDDDCLRRDGGLGAPGDGAIGVDHRGDVSVAGMRRDARAQRPASIEMSSYTSEHAAFRADSRRRRAESPARSRWRRGSRWRRRGARRRARGTEEIADAPSTSRTCSARDRRRPPQQQHDTGSACHRRGQSGLTVDSLGITIVDSRGIMCQAVTIVSCRSPPTSSRARSTCSS